MWNTKMVVVRKHGFPAVLSDQCIRASQVFKVDFKCIKIKMFYIKRPTDLDRYRSVIIFMCKKST